MDIHDVYNAVKDVEGRQIEMIAKQAEHTVVLQEHKNYSLALQKEQEKINIRIEPIEKTHHLVTLFLKGAGMILVGLVVQYCVKRLLGH
jgi:hypothetical protein